MQLTGKTAVESGPAASSRDAVAILASGDATHHSGNDLPATAGWPAESRHRRQVGPKPPTSGHQLGLGGNGQVKAAAFYEYGPAEAMQYADIPDPEIGPGDVLVQVQACGVNHSDLDSRAGTSRWPFELPMVLGAEFTGTVVGVGDQTSPIRTGDLVTALQQYSCGRCDAVRQVAAGSL